MVKVDDLKLGSIVVGGKMKRQIRIMAGLVTVLAELNATKTADAIWQALPSSGRPIDGGRKYTLLSGENRVRRGTRNSKRWRFGLLASGKCPMHLLLGPTPTSRESEIRAASQVNIFGRLIGDAKVFKEVKEGERIVVEKI